MADLKNESVNCTGLTSAEVEQRVKEGKVNGEQTVRTKSVAQILCSNIFTFFNFLFIGLAILLAFFVPKDISGFGNFSFLILIVFNTLVGIFQELRAKRTMDKLSLLSAPRATVVRDGEESEIAIETLVLDDITLLSAGSQICADGIIVDGSCEVNESLITGEPDAIVKNVGDEVMSGSFVVSGKAKSRVCHVGMDNFVMKISAGAKYFKKPSSEIWRSLMWVVKVMAILIVPIGIALFCSKYFKPNDGLNDTVLTVIGSVVGMIPSGLVALTSTVFCVGIIRLSKHKTLAQDLYCVETLARVDVLCLDKTGTITEGSMEVNSFEPRDGLGKDEFKQIVKNLASAVDDDNATAMAIREYLEDLPVTEEAEMTIPFSSARKWSGARFNGRSYALGASEFVLPHADDAIKATTTEAAEKGYRVLVLASSESQFGDGKLPSDMNFEGFVFITDKIRKEAPDTLKFFREQGVNVKIISGDNPVTVRAVALRAGLEKCDEIIDMSTVSPEQIEAAAEKYTIFGRVLPDQKLALVKALKAHGHTVAMTGDGVNDVLALKEADCSVAMASGSDAAKNVSSLILMDSNFASMPKVVAEGRRSINNLERSASLYLMKTVYNLLLAMLFMIIPNSLPFEPRQLTLIGGVTIGLPSVVIALEPNKERVTGHFLPKVLCSAFPGGLTVMLGIIGVIVCGRILNLNTEELRSMYLLATTLVGLVYLFRVCLPFNWLHGVTYVTMIGLFAACYFVKLPFFDIQKFFGLHYNISMPMLYAFLGIAASAILIFTALSLSTRNLSSEIDRRIDRRLRLKTIVYTREI